MYEILGGMNILGIATGICIALLSKYKRRHFEHERVIKKKIKMNLKILECKVLLSWDSALMCNSTFKYYLHGKDILHAYTCGITAAVEIMK
jgi:hypothetical protein